MNTLSIDNAQKVLDTVTSKVIATREEHALFTAAIDRLYSEAKQAAALKAEIDFLKNKLK